MFFFILKILNSFLFKYYFANDMGAIYVLKL